MTHEDYMKLKFPCKCIQLNWNMASPPYLRLICGDFSTATADLWQTVGSLRLKTRIVWSFTVQMPILESLLFNCIEVNLSSSSPPLQKCI